MLAPKNATTNLSAAVFSLRASQVTSWEAGPVFFRQFETKTNVYSGAADKEALLAYIKPLMVPTVFAFTEDEIEAVFG